MQFAKRRKSKPKFKEKTCQYPGCGKSFIGHVVSKYCKFHHDPKNRKDLKKNRTTVDENNKIIKHNFQDITQYEVECGLKGCSNKFTVDIIPKQYIYPKYCSEHRVKFRREQFLKEQKKVHT